MVLKQEKMGNSYVKTGNFFILILLSLILLSNAGSAADTGWVAPSNNAAGSGGTVTSPANAYSNNSVYATFSSSGTPSWNYFGYGFSSIPSGATIDKIEVNAEGYRSGTGTNRYMQVRLSWDNGATWTNPSTSTTEWTSSPIDHILIGSTNDWGHTWTRDELVNSFRIEAHWMGSATGYLDYIPVRVTYTAGAGTTYSVSGYVTNASNGAAISGATVSVNSTPTQTTSTNGTGYYNFSLINGTYLITASSTNYNANSITRTVNGAPVPNADIALTPAPAGTGGKILVASNRYVVLDDPKTGSFSGTGFKNPSNSWSSDTITGVETTITMWAMLIDSNGMPMANRNVNFTLKNPVGTNDYTFTKSTDNNGLVNVTRDLNNKNYYGNWQIIADSDGLSQSTSFIYNWWGCGGGAGCSGHSSKSWATGAEINSPYATGHDGAVDDKSDHYATTTDCTECHLSYNGQGSTPGMNTADRHSSFSCDDSNCHGTKTQHRTNMVIGSCDNCHTRGNITKKSTLNGILSTYSTTSTYHDQNSSIPCIICHGPMHNITKPDPTVGGLNDITEDTHCTTCHTNYQKHNGGVGCTLCHSQDVHAIKVLSQSGGYVNKGSTSQGNCTNCHQNASFLTALKQAPKAGSYTGSAPQVQIPLNHSTDGAGTKWGTYWTNTKDACIYCHGDNKHVATRLGNAAVAVGTDPIGGAIGSGTVCASCHNSTDNDYAAIMALLNPDPVAFKPGTNWNTSGTDHASYGTTDADCKTCHGGVLSGSADISEFVHNVDVGKGGDDCIGCHTTQKGNFPGIDITKFTKHENVNTTGGNNVTTNDDCKTCHTDISNMYNPGFNVVTKTCSDCHTSGQYGAKVIDNHKQNGVNISTGVSCAVCHNNSVNSSFAYSDNATVSHYTTKTSLIATQDCTYCHKNPANASTWGNALDPAGSPSFPHSISNTPTGECYTCHNSAINFHNKTLEKPSVSTVTCLDCHKTTATMAPKEIDATVFGTGVHKNRACTDCHANATDSNMNNYQFSNDPAKTCTYCHVNSSNLEAPQVAEHNQVGQDAITSNATCNTCHDNSGMYLSNSGTNGTTSAITHYLKDVTNRSTTPYQHFGPINTADCIDCHNGPNTSNPNWGNPTNISNSTIRPHTETLTSQCDTCHNDGNVSTLANVDFHNKSIKRAPADDCIGCHKNAVGIYAAINTASFTKHENVNTTGGNNVTTNDDCKTCHTDISNMYNPGFNVVTKTCSDCHTSGLYGAKVIDNHKQNGVNISTAVSCAVCHNNSVNSSFAYSNNATVSHYVTKTSLIATQDCTYCHKNPANASTWGNALDPAGSPSFPHSISNTPTGDCYTCHNSADNFHNKTLVKPAVSTVTCLDCHKTTATMAPKKIDSSVIAIGVHKNRACENCHTNATDTNMNNYQFSNDPAKTCTYCHVNSSNLEAPQVAEHNQVGQDAITSNATCNTCHDNSGMYLSNSGTNGTTSAITHYLKDVTNRSTTPYQHFGPINTADCIDCHNGPNTSNPNWGNPTNISNSTIRPHTETLTSQCDTCHNDGNVSTLANVDFHNKSIKRAPADDCIGCHKNAVGIYAAINTASFTKHENVNTTGGNNVTTNDDCKTCHTDITNMYNPGWTTPTKVCSDCHTSGQYGAKVIDNHRQNGVNISTGVSCAVCHNNSVNSSFAYSDNATVSHYATKTSLIATQDCTYCHKNPANASTWGNALDPAGSPSFPHSISNTPTGECYTCHKSAINFHNKTLEKPSVSTVTCLDCHKTTATMAPKEIDATVFGAGVHKNRACTDCHTNATDTNMNTYSFTTDPAKTCTYCHTGTGNFNAPLVAEHNQNGQNVITTASCATCHSNSGMYLSNSGTNGTTTAITHYLKDVTNTATTPYQHFGPIDTSDCIDCHNGPNTSNPNWGNPVNISNSMIRPHTETLTSECNTCHSDGGASLANVDFHNASVQLGAGGCTGCHSNVGTNLGLHSSLSGTSGVEDSDCQTCHFGSFPMTTGAANSTNTYYCQACHTTSGTGPVKPTNPSLIKDGLNHGSTDCKWCHAAGDQPDYKYHSSGPRGTATGQNCRTCHYYANLSALPFRAPGEIHSDNEAECNVCHEGADNHNAPILPGTPPTITQPTINGLSGTTSITSGSPANIQATVNDNMMVVSAAQYQITNGTLIVKDWTNMTGAFNSNNVVVGSTFDTTSLTGTYTVSVKGMASGPGSGPNYPLNGQWSSIASTQLIITESKGYINGTVRNNSVNISGAIVTTNTGITAITDANGFYSLSLTNGTYQLTTVKEPEFYTNSSVSVTVTAPGTVTRDIILNRKPTGTISGKVTVK